MPNTNFTHQTIAAKTTNFNSSQNNEIVIHSINMYLEQLRRSIIFSGISTGVVDALLGDIDNHCIGAYALYPSFQLITKQQSGSQTVYYCLG